MKSNSRAIARMSLWQIRLIVYFLWFLKRGVGGKSIVRLSQNGVFDRSDLQKIFSFIAGTLKYTRSLFSVMSYACSCWCTEDPVLVIILHLKRSNFKQWDTIEYFKMHTRSLFSSGRL